MVGLLIVGKQRYIQLLSKPAVVGVFTDNYTFANKFLLVKTRSKGIMHRFFENPKQLLYIKQPWKT